MNPDNVQPGASAWIGDADCMAHSSDWQYWTRGKRHCLGCLRDAWQVGSGDLMRLAGDMVRCNGMPSPYRDDWPPRLRWGQVEREADKANEAAKLWAIRLRTIVDSIHGRAPSRKRQEES